MLWCSSLFSFSVRILWNGTEIAGPFLIFHHEIQVINRTQAYETDSENTLWCVSESNAGVVWYFTDASRVPDSPATIFQQTRTTLNSSLAILSRGTAGDDNTSRSSGLWICRLNGSSDGEVPVGIYHRDSRWMGTSLETIPNQCPELACSSLVLRFLLGGHLAIRAYLESSAIVGGRIQWGFDWTSLFWKFDVCRHMQATHILMIKEPPIIGDWLHTKLQSIEQWAQRILQMEKYANLLNCGQPSSRITVNLYSCQDTGW